MWRVDSKVPGALGGQGETRERGKVDGKVMGKLECWNGKKRKKVQRNRKEEDKA